MCEEADSLTDVVSMAELVQKGAELRRDVALQHARDIGCQPFPGLPEYFMRHTIMRGLAAMLLEFEEEIRERDELLRSLGEAGLEALLGRSAYTPEQHHDLFQRLARIHEFGVEAALRGETEQSSDKGEQ